MSENDKNPDALELARKGMLFTGTIGEEDAQVYALIAIAERLEWQNNLLEQISRNIQNLDVAIQNLQRIRGRVN